MTNRFFVDISFLYAIANRRDQNVTNSDLQSIHNINVRLPLNHGM